MRMEYDDLPLEERVAACLDLMHACLEMPCMRNFLSQRTEAQEAAASALIEAQKQDRAKKTQRHMYVQVGPCV